jgi:hypothetical protein
MAARCLPVGFMGDRGDRTVVVVAGPTAVAAGIAEQPLSSSFSPILSADWKRSFRSSPGRDYLPEAK